jgi:hypothetical protein
MVQAELGTPFAEVAAELSAVGMAGLVRVGIATRLELRAGMAWYLDRTLDTAQGDLSDDGVTDLEIGAKVLLTDGSSRAPALVLIPSVTLPTGSTGFGAERAAFDITAAAGWSLPANTGLTTVAAIAWTPDDAENYATSGLLAAVLATSLGERWGGYAETAYLPAPGDDALYAGGGLTLAVSGRVQLDASVDRALGGAGTDWLFGLGTSFRL